MKDRRRRPTDPGGERSLRGLVSTSDTQVPSELAMRAREVDLPSSAELARVEAEMILVRRHYRPPAPLPAAGRRAGPQRPVQPLQPLQPLPPAPGTGVAAQAAGSSGSTGSAS